MKKIQVYGKEYPMRMTMGAMRRFKQETGMEVSEMTTEASLMVQPGRSVSRIREPERERPWVS